MQDLPTLQSPVVRLPSITSKWKRPGEDDKPAVTIDELERCMGDDLALQSEVAELKQRQNLLEAQRLKVEEAGAGLMRKSETLEARRTALQGSLDQLKLKIDLLHARGLQIEHRKQQTPKSPADVRAINSSIAAYNADGGRLNAERAALLKEQSEFGRQVAAYNAEVPQVNLNAMEFNAMNNEFQSFALAITRRSDAFSSICAGKRELKK